MSVFLECLQAARQKLGLSCQAMADTLQVTSRTYQHYEEGKREPSYDRLVSIVQELNVSTDYLLGLTDQ